METAIVSDSIKDLKIILVDDNIPFRAALKKLLEIQYGCVVIAEASNGLEFLQLTNITSSDLIIMDLMMPKLNGLNATKEITWQYPSLKIIAITMHNDQTYLMDLVLKGFKGCIFKTDLYNKIYDAVHAIYNGEFFFSKDLLLKKNF